MSSVELASKWLERASDVANPILVKETRQILKSRQFIITFTLLLIASWLISVFGILIAGDAIEYGSAGRAFFGFYYCVLAIAIFIIVPFGAYRSLLNERDQNTYELLSITTLKPRQIVWGKLLSTMVQVFIFYSAIAPFIAFTSLLQGFDLTQVVFVLVISCLASLGFSMIALMASTVAKQKAWQSLISLAVFGSLALMLITIFYITAALLAFPLPLDDPDFSWGLSLFLICVLSYFILAQQITTAQLTFESDNRSTGIRIICSIQFWLLWGLAFVVAYFTGGLSTISTDSVVGFVILSAIHWTIVGLFAATERDFLSRRIRRGLPRNRLLRLLIAPFLPGGNRGTLYLFLHIVALWILGCGMIGVYGGTSRWVPEYVTALCCYVVIYLGIGAALGRAARNRSSEIRPALVRVSTFLLFAAGIVGPYLPYAFNLMDGDIQEYSLIFITHPFETLDAIVDGRGTMGHVVNLLLCAAALAFFVNIRARLWGVMEILTAEVKPRTGIPAS